MTKEPKKPEVKREPKKELPTMRLWEFLAVLLLMTFVLGSLFFQVDTRLLISETNRLLATFQRIDTVKDDIDQEGVSICGDWSSTLFSDGTRGPKLPPCKRDPQSDPNLCKTWTTICKDGPIGPQCDVVCSIGEGIE